MLMNIHKITFMHAEVGKLNFDPLTEDRLLNIL